MRLACVVQARPDELRRACGAEILCIPDPDRESYHSLGLGRMRLWKLFTSRELRRRRARARSLGFRQDWRRTFARESDGLRLPGAALIARGGRILWLHRGEHVADLPAADDLLAIASEFATPVRF